jgi:beta-glucosidase bgl3E
MKYRELIEKMSLEEKAAILSGKNEWRTRDIKRLDIPSISCSDGPHGVRKQDGLGDHLGLNVSLPATCFPTAASIASSWNEELGEDIGKALGEEAKSLGVNILLGPGLNIKRSPLCGRNFEYFSEDPYLSGKMTAAYVRGIQSKGVYSCIKHFAVNSQEEIRMAMNSVLDERTLREIYLTGFEIGVKEGKAKALMTSYNRVNGEYANENEHLLVDILRGEWGFDGIVITDWGGSNDHTKGVLYGSNLEMPGPGYDSAKTLIEDVKAGILDEEVLDRRVDELLQAVFETSNNKKSEKFDIDKHHALARRAASESIILLENKEAVLPIKEKKKVALIGDFAFVPRYQGAGSSVVNATKLDSIASCIDEYKNLELIGKAHGYERVDKENEALLKEARELAGKADIVLLCFGLDEISESEGLDRKHLSLPKNQLKLIDCLAEVNNNIIGILSAGSVVEMPWKDKFKGLLHTYLSGQAGAAAVLDILTGKVNPSGKLAESYPVNYSDSPCYKYYPAKNGESEYKEALYVGYRYYEKQDIKLNYPFGYGLSYTSFEYSALNACEDKVSFKLKNTGTVAGAEVCQLYISKKDSKIFRAQKELKGFRKVYLEVGEEKEVSIFFDDKSFRYWNIITNSWEIEAGTYEIHVGSGSADIRLSSCIEKEGTSCDMLYEGEIFKNYFSGKIKNINDKEFEALLGAKRKSIEKTGLLQINDALCRMKNAKSFVARFIYKRLENAKIKAEKKGKPDLNILFIYNMPFRALAKMSAGKISMEMAYAILDICNGRGLKAYLKLIKGHFKNVKVNKAYDRLLGYNKHGKNKKMEG